MVASIESYEAALIEMSPTRFAEKILHSVSGTTRNGFSGYQEVRICMDCTNDLPSRAGLL